MDDSPDPYDVGRGKPPRWTQFRKGQSGNPKGRPKKKVAEADLAASELDDIYRRELNRKIRVKDGEGTRELTAVEVVARSQIQTAAKGSPHAQRDVLKAAEELARRDAARREAEEERERQLFLRMVEFQKKRAQEWTVALQQGGEPADPWPHPDDILLNHEKQTWRVRGPVDADDLALFEYYRAERDSLFARAMLDRIQRPAGEFAKPSIWDLWISWDALLPLRWQALGDLRKWEDLICLPLRALSRLEREYTAKATALRASAGLSPPGKHEYRTANATLRPVLKKQGYRSLAEFERVYEDTGGNPPRPKRTTA